MIKRNALTSMLGLALSLSLSGNLPAREEQEIVVQKELIPGLTDPIPISISGFSSEVSSVLRYDLYVQGFEFVKPEEALYLLSGDGGWKLKSRFGNETLLSRRYTGGTPRKQAHAFSDDVVKEVTGKAGIAQTRIAFKVVSGRNSEVYVADFDGHGAKAVTRDNSLVAAPTWVPGKLALYYTSYKLGNPDIYSHDLTTGARAVVSRHTGLNTSAAVSPDGSRVAMILSKDGSPDVYVADRKGGDLRRLTTTTTDASSPCWSPDGKWVCFASKLRGRRALAKVPAAGGSISRITTGGVVNPSEPAWSPDGKYIAFTAQMGGFNICIVPAGGGTATVLVGGEDPSWAPNSRTLIFTRRSGARRTLSLLDVFTKHVKDVARVSGNSSQPSWER